MADVINPIDALFDENNNDAIILMNENGEEIELSTLGCDDDDTVEEVTAEDIGSTEVINESELLESFEEVDEDSDSMFDDEDDYGDYADISDGYADSDEE